jgi:flagellar basal-body rod protein FlgG
MDRGLYIAATGMLAQQVRQDQLANDIANAATPGYKADRSAVRSFPDMLLSNTRTGESVGPLGAGAHVDATVTDLSPQVVKPTSEPLDFAVQGEGYFAVNTPQGQRFTRNGAFTEGADGSLVDQLGQQVLGRDGQPLQVGADGKVDPSLLGVFAVPDARKQGDSLFTGTANGAGTGKAISGALEGSGIEPTTVMVDMMASMRAYEAGQKAIQTIDSTLDKAANQVGTVPG